MSKLILDKKKNKSSTLVRESFKFYYNQKFFNKWMNTIKLDGLNYQQIEFIMKKFWSDGTIAVSKPVGIPTGIVDKMEDYDVIFTPWTMQGLYNIYDYPIQALPINLRGVSFISTKPLDVDKDIVIIYCQKNHKSVFSSIEAKFNELIDIEMVKRVCLKVQKMPWLFTTTPENKQAIENLARDLDGDEPTLFTTLSDAELGKGLGSNAPYILDKLEQQRQKVENDILTILSTNNVGIAEKKEHLIVDEVNANNQEIQDSGNDFVNMVQEGFDRVKQCFGKEVKVSLIHEPMMDYEPNEDEEQDGGDENDE